MEVEEGCGDVGTVRRTTRQSTKKNVEPVQPVQPVEPEPKPERNKRKKEPSSASRKPSRKRRSKTSNNNEVPAAPEIAAESGNGELKQSSWSSASGFSPSDEEDLPTVVFTSPAKASGKREYKKHDIVWVKNRDVYRPSLITKVNNKKNYVSCKFVNETTKYIWKVKLDKIIPFDDPDKNIELLNEGRRKYPRVVDAYDRVKHYLCRLSEQDNLSPIKYLLPVKTEDLLYGIVPELEQIEGEDPAGSKDEFDRPILDLGESDSDENEDEENEADDLECSKDDQPKEKTIYDKISDEDKAKISEKIKALLDIIRSEDCFNYLKQLVEEPGENCRMKLLNEMDEAQLMYKSGLGPFFVAERLETDQLTDILDDYAKKLNFCGDVSLLQRHVLQPEAIVFALQTLCKLEREPAETFFLKWTFHIPEWVEP